MKLLSPALSKLARLRCKKIEEWIGDPDTIQREVLQDLVTHAQHSAFGRKYRFNSLFSIKDFKAQVPIHEYNDLFSCIQALMKGEQYQLWDAPVSWFAKSSGTSGAKSKFTATSRARKMCFPCIITSTLKAIYLPAKALSSAAATR